LSGQNYVVLEYVFLICNALCVCLICRLRGQNYVVLEYVVFYVCLICMPYMYALYVGLRGQNYVVLDSGLCLYDGYLVSLLV
jgi:hypothetical protein